jgi:hypothetical protein
MCYFRCTVPLLFAPSGPRVCKSTSHLECRAGVGDEVLKEGLEPGTGLRSRLLRITSSEKDQPQSFSTMFRHGYSLVAAESVEARRARVGGTVRLTSRLDPDDGVNEVGASVSGGAGTEASTVDVAPVTPGVTDVLNARAALVDDEVGGERGQEGSESIDVVDLVVVVISLGDGVWGCSTVESE